MHSAAGQAAVVAERRFNSEVPQTRVPDKPFGSSCTACRTCSITAADAQRHVLLRSQDAIQSTRGRLTHLLMPMNSQERHSTLRSCLAAQPVQATFTHPLHCLMFKPDGAQTH